MKLKLELTPKEIRKAVLDFLYENAMIPEGVDEKTILVEVSGKYGGSGGPWVNKCVVDFTCEVPTAI